MSHSDQWIEWREQFQKLPVVSQILCSKLASRRLEESMRGTGQGISSSDVSHQMFGMWKNEANMDMNNFISVCAEDYWRTI